MEFAEFGFTHKSFGESNLFNDRVSVAGVNQGSI